MNITWYLKQLYLQVVSNIFYNVCYELCKSVNSETSEWCWLETSKLFSRDVYVKVWHVDRITVIYLSLDIFSESVQCMYIL